MTGIGVARGIRGKRGDIKYQTPSVAIVQMLNPSNITVHSLTPKEQSKA
jgi:hypothetical protein